MESVWMVYWPEELPAPQTRMAAEASTGGVVIGDEEGSGRRREEKTVQYAVTKLVGYD